MSRSKLMVMKVDLAHDWARNLAYKYAVLDHQDQLMYVFVGNVRKVLVREHAALVRAVRRLHAQRLPNADSNLPWEQGYVVACEDVLALLAARKGRTR